MYTSVFPINSMLIKFHALDQQRSREKIIWVVTGITCVELLSATCSLKKLKDLVDLKVNFGSGIHNMKRKEMPYSHSQHINPYYGYGVDVKK